MKITQTQGFLYGNGLAKSAQNGVQNGAFGQQKAEKPQGMSMRQLLSENRQKQQNQGIVNQTLGYSESIRASRAKAKDAALEVKKLQYDFKGISSQIMRSKTSASARMVVSKAKREVLRLKRQKQNGGYDEEELEAAITHAKAMERAAKKKVHHLEEEEMMKVSGGPCMGEDEDQAEVQKEATNQEAQNEAALEEQELLEEQLAEASEEELQKTREIAQEMMEEVAESIEEELAASMDEMMTDMMDELWESMQDMMEELDLSDLAEGMFAPSKEMDPADFKMMKIKHRSEEMKVITKADAEYLKTIFKQLEKGKTPGISGGGSATLPGGNGATQPMQSQPAALSAMTGVGMVSTPAVSIDISV